MTEITYKRFEPQDAFEIQLREHESNVLNRKWLSEVGQIDRNGLWTFFYNGDIVGIIGYWERWHGVAQVLVIPSIHTFKCGSQFFFVVRKHLKRIAKLYHRLQTESWDNPTTNRWMRLLGFTEEGRLKKYAADGSDYRMWAIVNAEFAPRLEPGELDRLLSEVA